MWITIKQSYQTNINQTFKPVDNLYFGIIKPCLMSYVLTVVVCFKSHMELRTLQNNVQNVNNIMP